MRKLFDLVDRMWELLVLNFIWIVYMFRGAIILGFFPATAAVYGVLRHWNKNGMDQKTLSLFKQFYRENFKNANVLGWLLSVLSAMVFLNWYLLPSITSPAIKIIIYGIIIPFSIFLILMWTYLFPILVHFELRWINYLIVIFKFSVTYFSYTVLQLALIVLYGMVFAQFPIFMMLFGFTIIALGQVAICSHIFEKVYAAEKVQMQH